MRAEAKQWDIAVTIEGADQLLSMNTHGPIYGAEERHDERAATLSGLMGLLFVTPRVARSSQPWAQRCNPFGIEPRGLAPQKLVALGFQPAVSPISNRQTVRILEA